MPRQIVLFWLVLDVLTYVMTILIIHSDWLGDKHGVFSAYSTLVFLAVTLHTASIVGTTVKEEGY